MWRRVAHFAQVVFTRCFAPALVLVALLTQHVMREWVAGKPFLLLYPAIFLGAMVGETLSRITATVLAIVGAWVYFIPAYGTFTLNKPTDKFGLLVFAITCVAVDLLCERISSSQRALGKTLQLRADFLSIASHELRAPCTTLKMQNDLVRRRLKRDDEVNIPRLEKYLVDTAYQVERLARLLDDMLDVSRIDAGQLSLELTPFDLYEVAQEIVEKMQPQLQAAGCDVSVAGDGPVQGAWDRARIEQVIINLLSNAAKYGAGKPVRVQVDKDDVYGRISVQDHGVGIDARDVHRIFKRFERANEGSKRTSLGLGLYLVSQIVEAHRGKVKLESTVGEGSIFTVQLTLDESLTKPGFS